ncbi:MAG: hypothetical protein FJZ92_07635, partial [Chloroflexi bacterium]|nr:hypothetical protein [Chloroflexota bacterium]
MTGPLAGVRAIDLAGESGVFAGRMLAELGADVIRLEPPGGDAVRRRPPFAEGATGADGRPVSLYHLHFNAGKRSVALDHRTAAGAEALRRLAAHTDLWLDTAAPGEMEALGLGYEALAAIRPALVYTTITPFGLEGPMRGYRANDLVGAATSGLMYLNGYAEDPPNVPGAEQAYHMASLAAVASALVALAGRERDPERRGRRVDVSMQDAASMATLQTANANYYTWHNRIPRRHGNHTANGGQLLHQCGDGKWLSFTVPVGGGPFFGFFLDWLRDEGIADGEVFDPRYQEPRYRATYPAAMTAAIAALCSRHGREWLFHEGQRRRLLLMPVNEVPDLMRDAQLRVRDYFVALEHPELGRSLELTGVPYHFSATPAQLRRPAPRLGEHDDEVLRGLLGMSDAEVAALSEGDRVARTAARGGRRRGGARSDADGAR